MSRPPRAMAIATAAVVVLVTGPAAPAGGARPAPRPAAAGPPIGIGDQDASSFANTRFRRLGVRTTRLVMPWDAVFHDRAWLDGWMTAARRAHLRPLVAFSYARSDSCDQP